MSATYSQKWFKGEKFLLLYLKLFHKLWTFFKIKKATTAKKVRLEPECGELGMSELKNGFCMPCIGKLSSVLNNRI